MKLSPTPLLLVLWLPTLAAGQQSRPGSPTPPESVVLAVPTQRELAGKPLDIFPHFQFTRTFNQGDTVRIAFDPKTDPSLQKRTVDVYLIEHEDLLAHLTGKKLRSVLGRPMTIKLGQEGVRENTFVLDTGRLAATARPDSQGTYLLGKGYDVVVDVNVNAGLDAGDLVDGSLAEAGFTVVEDFVTFDGPTTKTTGPYAVTEVLFDGGTTFTQEDIYFPSTIAALGTLPLIVVSHGNGHNYQWYDHLGYHMASWGYVVMSHANNTGPGIETASTSTLRNTETLLANLGTIAGGALAGHVDSHRIVWIGHSRGGEGVTRAHKRLADGSPIATLYTLDDIKLVSSIAPTDFLGPNVSDVGAVPYHLWTGGSDADVNGCADCDICQTFHLLERADAVRFSLSLHGAGHGDFHDGGGSSVASGPRQIGRKLTHQIMRAYFLPLVQYNLHGNKACLDYLTRQWEEFRALGAPYPGRGQDSEDAFVVADLMFVPKSGRYVIDDFQSEPALARSSSGGAVLASDGLAPTLLEGLQNDANNAFTSNDVDPMNGMTFSGPGDSARGAVLEWNGTDEWLSFEVPAGSRDLSAFRTLSFRAAQATRDTITTLEELDLDFTVELIDANLKSSAIRLSAYGGGIEEPYQRASCGAGRGWANEFETIRLPLGDFRRDGTPLDLANIAAITFRFGPSHGSSAGRIGLDELLFSAE